MRVEVRGRSGHPVWEWRRALILQAKEKPAVKAPYFNVLVASSSPL